MSKIAGYLFVFSVILFIFCFVKRNEFSDDRALHSEVEIEPLQSPVKIDPFEVQFKDTTYRVRPLYDYEISGLVVSFRHHSGDSMLHKLWNDHLNTTDLCIVWRENASHPNLNKLDFWNGQFTCNVQTRDQQAWNRFDMNQLSNNHLISEDEWLREQIAQVKIGDQIQLSGWLSAYSAAGGPERGTSTTRTDTGNGACETIYVKSFHILSANNNPWRSFMWLSLVTAFASLSWYFFAPFQMRN